MRRWFLAGTVPVNPDVRALASLPQFYRVSSCQLSAFSCQLPASSSQPLMSQPAPQLDRAVMIDSRPKPQLGPREIDHGCRHSAACVAGSSGLGNTEGGQEIRARRLKHWSIEFQYFYEYPPADFPALVTNADTIARVVVMTAHSSLIGEKIWTDFGAQVLSISKGDRQLETRTITVRKAGGTVSRLRVCRILGTESGFPPFELADEYVLFPEDHARRPLCSSLWAAGRIQGRRGQGYAGA